MGQQAGDVRLDAVDVEANVRRYLGRRADTGRYASFDYCFNYFRDYHSAGELDALTSPGRIEMSCLQLGFYLASWGMFRGKAQLRSFNAKRLIPVIEAIAAAPPAAWTIDADDYGTAAQTVLTGVYSDLRRALPGGQSTTLVTKTMLGVFGSVPAYDRFFRAGFGGWTFGPKSLRRLEAFYRANAETIDCQRVPTLDSRPATRPFGSIPAPRYWTWCSSSKAGVPTWTPPRLPNWGRKKFHRGAPDRRQARPDGGSPCGNLRTVTPA